MGNYVGIKEFLDDMRDYFDVEPTESDTLLDLEIDEQDFLTFLEEKYDADIERLQYDVDEDKQIFEIHNLVFI